MPKLNHSRILLVVTFVSLATVFLAGAIFATQASSQYQTTGKTINISLAFIESLDFKIYAFNTVNLSDPNHNPTVNANVGDKLVFDVRNSGKSFHAFAITNSTSGPGPAIDGTTIGTAEDPMKPGASGEIIFIPTQAGTYYYICAVPGHRELGMEGKILVTASSTSNLIPTPQPQQPLPISTPQPTPDNQMVENKINEIISHQKISVNPTDDINTLIFKGIAFNTYYGPVKALYYFDAALKIDPSNQETQKQRGYAYQQISSDASRITDYDNMLEKDPSSVQGLEGECQIYTELHDYDTSIGYCNQILNNSPDDQTAIISKYTSLIGQEKYEEALPLSSQIPDAPFNENYLKIIPLYQLGKYDELIENIDAKIQLDSAKGFSVAALLLMIDKAVILEKMGNTSDYNAIISVITSNLGPRDNIDELKGISYFKLQDYSMANQYFEKIQIPADDETGYMKVIAEDQAAQSNPISTILSSTNQSNQSIFDELIQFFNNLFHWK